MNRFLDWFGRTPRSTRTSAHRPRPFRPQLEQLGERLVPSTISSAIAIPHGGGVMERDWFAIDQTTGQAVEVVGTARYNLGGPSNIKALSASIDPITGYGEVFALSGGSLWLCNSDGYWYYFGGNYGGISASRDGHVYAVTADGAHVWYLDSNGAGSDLGAPNTGSGPWASNSLAASTYSGIFLGGGNEVFAIGPGAAVYVNRDSPGNWQVVDKSTRFISLSASTDDTVFALTWDGYGQGGKLYQETQQLKFNGYYIYYVWVSQDISGGRIYGGRFSADTDASGQAEVYAEDGGGTVWLYDQGSWAVKATGGPTDISAAGGGYFYVSYYSWGSFEAYQYNPSNPWIPWTDLGSGLE